MDRSISVFGSAMVRVPPDVAAIRVSLSRVKKKPADAFADANLAAKQLYSYLKSFGVDDVCSSRVHLSRAEGVPQRRDEVFGVSRASRVQHPDA